MLRSLAVSTLDTISRTIAHCEACPRLRKHCLAIAREKRKAYRGDTYWGRPITGFGDPGAKLLIVGLAPAAHGANRTGRIFTGDRSGEWLYRALHKAGLANLPASLHREDGLKLKDTFISCVVRCAPPDNKPTPAEIQRCGPFLDQEIKALGTARVFVALGQIAYHALWDRIGAETARPKFGHGVEISLENGTLLLSFHPSQQNTFTGRLTEPMFDQVFARACQLMKYRLRPSSDSNDSGQHGD